VQRAEKVKHCKKIARWHDHVVAEPASNDRVMHDGLVGLVLEVAIPARAEFWAGPLIHHVELCFSRANLDTSFNTVGGKWASAIDVPLVKYAFLDRRVATSKVIERLNMGLCTISSERKAEMDMSVYHSQRPMMNVLVILKIETNAWQVHERLDTSLAELLWITDT
jgi:hypothetical protein